MITHIYTIPGCLYWDDKPETIPYFVFIFTCPPYREQVGLHAYHKRRRAWAKNDEFGCCVIAGRSRTRQIERWCQLSRLKCEVK